MSVITLHFPQVFTPLVAKEAYLAVDLFFVMSGFVLARAYDGRLHQNMGTGSFLLARLFRLYPIYLLALLPSVVELAYFYRNDNLSGAIALSGFFNLVMLPTPPIGIPDNPLFPANFVAWTLFFELVANAIYAAGIRWLTGARLRLLVGVFGILLLGAALWRGDLNGGAYWKDVWLAVVRVIFSFFFGVLIRREHDAGRFEKVDVPSWVPVATTLAALGLPVPTGLRGAFDAVCVLVIFPLVVIAAVARAPRAQFGVATFLGEISYPIYVLQIPVFTFAVLALPKLIPGHYLLSAPWSGLLMLAAVSLATWLLAIRFDIPMRHRLSAMFKARAAPGRTAGGM